MMPDSAAATSSSMSTRREAPSSLRMYWTLPTCVIAPQAERLDTLPTGRQLSYGAYHDQTRALRRVLKQVGAGSLEAGLAAVRADEAALREVSAVISLDPKARPGTAA